jgi:hypothetical protein
VQETYYVKRGRRYVPISYYDSNLADAVPAGSHLITVRPGSKSTRCHIEPDLAPLIAASLYAEDALISAILEASKIRLPEGVRKSQPLTLEQQLAWDRLVRSFGAEARQLQWPSAFEIAQAGTSALIAEAEKLLNCPAVKAAHDDFLLLCKLTKQSEEK